jgi:head-tail adaptor
MRRRYTGTRTSGYRTRVIVCRQDSSATAEDDGEIAESEEEVCTRWAHVWPVRGRERDVNDSLVADVTHLVRLRYDEITSDIDHKYWLTCVTTSERLNIVRAYDPDRRRREIELQCVQRV